MVEAEGERGAKLGQKVARHPREHGEAMAPSVGGARVAADGRERRLLRRSEPVPPRVRSAACSLAFVFALALAHFTFAAPIHSFALGSALTLASASLHAFGLGAVAGHHLRLGVEGGERGELGGQLHAVEDELSGRAPKLRQPRVEACSARARNAQNRESDLAPKRTVERPATALDAAQWPVSLKNGNDVQKLKWATIFANEPCFCVRQVCALK